MAEKRRIRSRRARETARKRQATKPVMRRPLRMVRQSDALTLQRAVRKPDTASAESILDLQSKYGNRAVSSLLDGACCSGIQAKLKVGPVGDSYEQEADRVAQQVMNMPAPAGKSALQRGGIGRVQMSPLAATIMPMVQRQEEQEIPPLTEIQRQEEEEAAETALVQRQEEQEIPPLTEIQRQEEEEAAETALVQRQEEQEIPPLTLIQRQEEEEAAETALVQRGEEEEEEAAETALVQRRDDGGFEASDDIETRLNARQGGGRPLSKEVRAFMEPRFAADFGGVRIHTGDEATGISRSLGAQAFTHGKDVYFGDGKYDPNTDTGKQLLAHELTHVVQQNGAAVKREEEGAGGGEEAAEEEGTLPDYEAPTEDDVTKGPDKHKGDKPRGMPESEATTGGTQIEVDDVGFQFSNPQKSQDELTGRTKAALGLGSVGFQWDNPGGAAVDAYGEEQFKPGYTALSYKKKGNKIKVNFTLDIKCPWGVNSGGSKDVASGTDALVTKDSYQKIAKDLMPKKKEKCWVEPWKKYWSESIAERHEKYHSTDDKKWAKKAGKKVVTDYVKKQSITGGNIAKKLKIIMKKAMTAMSNANWDFYTGKKGSYFSYSGEVRAYKDGKKHSVKLAKAVTKQGKKLAKAAKKAAKKAKK